MRHTCVLAQSAKQKLDERVIDLFSPLLTQSRSSLSFLVIDSLKTVDKSVVTTFVKLFYVLHPVV